MQIGSITPLQLFTVVQHHIPLYFLVLQLKHLNSTHIINYVQNLLSGRNIQLNNQIQTILNISLRINLWYSDRFLVYVQSNIKINQQYYSGNSSAVNLCGNASYSDSSYNFDITVDHSSPTALIYINSARFTGISDFYLYINKCPDGCDSCDQTLCFNQILFREYFTDINYSVINFSEGWLSTTNLWTKSYSENYLINCRDFSIHTTSFQVFTKTIQLDAHDAVSFSLKIITINLYHQIEILIDNVLIQFIFKTIIYSDQSNCIDFRTHQCEICTIVNHINIREHFHKKNKITIAIRLRVMQNYVFSFGYYLAIRDFQIFIRPFLNDDFCSDENIYQFYGCFAQIYDCVEGCSNCVKGECIECYEGWEYQEQTKECISICGDSIITHLEECDDGNTNPYDGCYQCKFSCPQDCLLFSFGQCSIWIILSYFLNVYFSFPKLGIAFSILSPICLLREFQIDAPLITEIEQKSFNENLDILIKNFLGEEGIPRTSYEQHLKMAENDKVYKTKLRKTIGWFTLARGLRPYVINPLNRAIIIFIKIYNSLIGIV